MILSEKIDLLPKTKLITIKKLKSLSIKTYFDLLNYFPFRYENYSLISKIGFVQPGEITTITGKIIDSKYQLTKTGLKIQIFKLADETGTIEVVFYNQPYLLKLFKINQIITVAGPIEKYGNKKIIKPTEYEIETPLKHTGKLIPIYPEKKGLSSKTLREKVYFILDNLKKSDEKLEFLPQEIIDFNNLLSENIAYQQIHFPTSENLAKKAKERLSFDELFLIQLSATLIKKEWEKEKVGHKFEVSNFKFQIEDFINHLPFSLTNSQKKVWQEILADLEKEKPMNRFIQGEVGSGKTVIAALACYLAYLNGFQSLLMAPTEILAIQHYHTISNLFKDYPIKIGLHTGSKKISNFQFPISNSDIIIGTHALIQKNISFEKVGLVIIDEQHRFGVNQRAKLKEKGLNPHLLTMTATPIPRTLALTIYKELDISIIDEMPKNRLPIKTYLVPKTKRQSAYLWIKDQILKHQSQVFIVCPLIEESTVETLKTVRAAKKEFENLKKTFSQFNLGLLHGKLKSKNKEKIMKEFKEKKYDILVTTPVVEVGIDIPNATIMIIEAAERFGLAQLHQLRGRVGRGEKQSYCFLFTEKENPQISKRLKLFSSTNNGNKLAEEDLKTRGPGDIYGTKQHGIIELKIASLSDYQMIEKTKKAVDYFIDHYNLEDFKTLQKRLEEYKVNQITKD